MASRGGDETHAAEGAGRGKPLREAGPQEPGEVDPNEYPPDIPESVKDEFGFPLAWRRPFPHDAAPEYEAGWTAFLGWCREAGVRPLPADPNDVLRFLEEAPVSRDLRYIAWKAIDNRHLCMYWEEAANPIQVLMGRGVRVSRDGHLFEQGTGEA